MDLTEAVNIFAVRLYEWARRDFLRELEEGCPLLSLIGRNQRRIGGLVSWNKILSSVDRKQLSRAAVLSFHNNARNFSEEPITEQDQHWAEEMYEQTTIHMEALPPLLSADRNAPTYRPAMQADMMEALSSCLPSVLGPPLRKASQISCTREMHDWRIVTEFCFAQREGNLLFEYQFVREDGNPVVELGYGPFPRNLLAFYGLYPHTVVSVPSFSDVEPMAKAMTKLAAHFIGQAEPLFISLGMND